MGDWGEEDGGAAGAWYLRRASDLLDETSAGFGTFVHDLSEDSAPGARIGGMARGASAMFLLGIAALCMYRIWRLCHAKPHLYYTKPKVTH